MSGKAKLQVYMILFSLVMSLVCIAVMRPGQHRSAADAKRTTTVQELRAIENAAPQSPEMSRFIQHEKAAQQANDEAANGLDP